MAWQLQEAKQKFSELVQRVLDEGPQVVTRRGEEVVVVVSSADFQRLTGQVPDFKDFLSTLPDLDNLEIRRAGDAARTIDL